MRDLYVADWHYGHEDILAYDGRPFVDLADMNAALVRLWNESVMPDDRVYVLGDMFSCGLRESIEVLDGLNGTKTLVSGNHDLWSSPNGLGADFVKRFDRIAGYLEVFDNDRNVVLSHYPMPCFKNAYFGWYHLYGHVHNSFEAHMMERDRMLIERLYGKPHRMYNVGIMMPWMGWAPRTLDDIVAGYEKNASFLAGEEARNGMVP